MIAQQGQETGLHAIPYPDAPQGDTVDYYHGNEVADPYRWLEQDSPARDDWVAAQRALLAEHAPAEEAVDDLYERIDSYLPDVWDGIPFKRGERSFFNRVLKGANYQVLMECTEEGGERVILDPNTWSEDGTIAPAGQAISPQGNYIAIARSVQGNDRQEWQIIDTITGEHLADTLPTTISTSTHWLDDETGFFYTQTLDDGRRTAYFHRLHTAHEQDLPYFVPEAGDLTWHSSSLSQDNRWLYIYGAPPNRPRFIDVIDLHSETPTAVRLLAAATASETTSVIYNTDEAHVILTDIGAANGRIVSAQSGAEWHEIIPESKHVLLNAAVVSNRILTTYYDGTKSYLKVFELDGKAVDTVLPPHDVGLTTFGYERYDNPQAYVYFESPVYANTTYSYDVRTGKLELLQESKYQIDTSKFTVSLEYATSKDGTRIPMLVCSGKDMVRDGSAPVILRGYGGFGRKMTPNFNLYALPWLEQGGVYVMAALRGGGEFGTEWHEAGKKLGKQRVFDDFTACAESLIEAQVTTPDKLVIKGGSNGGLLVGAVLLQRPDLVRVAMPSSGLFDMLRYDKGEYARVGVHWRREYGTTDDEAEFLNLLSYSPVHNIRPAEYPVVYATVGEQDDRVLPSHTYKFVAALQAAQLAPNPILVDIEPRSGHSLPGKERVMWQVAKEYAFLFKALGIPYP